MKVFLVSHTHWDREWYRTFQTFRARLVDTVDRVLELIAADDGFRFLLDGQTIALEDYLEVRPERRAALEAACRAGRLAIGPWYVQPDSLLPSGEAQVRNLREGRRVGAAFGPVSSVAYTPDSFGHPAQLPQIFAGFGLAPFVYWRGNGDEIDLLPAEYRWEAPDGSAVVAHHLGEGYFAASGLPAGDDAAGAFLADLAERLGARSRSGAVLLMNGFDHAPPEATTARAAAALARRTGDDVRRALLDDFAAALPHDDAPVFRGELLGARTANLLAGVWSTRTPQKLRNRRVEAELEAWAEPWSALGRVLGAPDERPSLRAAWRELLRNQAHDSICGCSQDAVHRQMEGRYDAAYELARETATRALERIAGLDTVRRAPWTDTFEIAVFNPSPHVRTDVVRFPLSPSRWLEFRDDGGGRQMALHPLLMADLTSPGFTVEGRPARVVTDPGTERIRLVAERAPRSVEFVAADVPAFGWRRFCLATGPACDDVVDDGREIAVDGVAVRVSDDGTLEVTIGGRTFRGLAAVEDTGDRGDTYDFDPVSDDLLRLDPVEGAALRLDPVEGAALRLDPVDGAALRLESLSVERARHASGIAALRVRRVLALPAALAAHRASRAAERVPVVLEIEARLVPGVARVDLRVRLDNRARDHRLRLLFPTGAAVEEFLAATTFDVARRRTARPDDRAWVHPAPTTFPHQGFVSAAGLTVAAPGLPEAEVAADGTIAITLVRSVGWLARMDLKTRPQVAGPTLPTPDAQCLTEITAELALLAGCDVRAVRDAEIGLRAVVAGPAALVPAGHALLAVEPADVVVSAVEPAPDGDGVWLRVLNPHDDVRHATVRLGFPCALAVPVRLDGTPSGDPLHVVDGVLQVAVPPHALRTLRLA